MTVCNFFLQGRCRYGDKCWNEHPRGGGTGGGYNNSRGSQPQFRGGGGFANRVWVNPSIQKGGYIQPSSFGSQQNEQWNRREDSGGSDWGGRGGGRFGRRDNVNSSEFSFSQNRFSALDTPSAFAKEGKTATGGDEDNDRKCELIQNDMESWESSGQWGFSTYSCAKAPISGFTDLSPEELRLEYYTARASGDLQNYISGVNLLLSQWRNRVQELKVMNATTRAALLRELNNAPQESSTGTELGSTFGFGSKGFGDTASDQLSSFSFSAPVSGFGSVSTPLTSASFGSASAAPPLPGFGSSPAPSASAFSFAPSDQTTPAAPSAFGSASGFSFSANTGGGFGTGFGVGTPATSGTSSTFVQTGVSESGLAAPANGTSDALFSVESNLSSEELNQFKAKRFTLGQIPLKPPPADLLLI